MHLFMSIPQEKSDEEVAAENEMRTAREDRQRQLDAFLERVKHRKQQAKPSQKVPDRGKDPPPTDVINISRQPAEVVRTKQPYSPAAGTYADAAKHDRERKVSEDRRIAGLPDTTKNGPPESKVQTEESSGDDSKASLDPFVKSYLLAKHLRQFRDTLAVQPKRHTEEQLRQEARRQRISEQQQQRAQLDVLREQKRMEFERAYEQGLTKRHGNTKLLDSLEPIDSYPTNTIRRECDAGQPGGITTDVAMEISQPSSLKNISHSNEKQLPGMGLTAAAVNGEVPNTWEELWEPTSGTGSEILTESMLHANKLTDTNNNEECPPSSIGTEQSISTDGRKVEPDNLVHLTNSKTSCEKSVRQLGKQFGSGDASKLISLPALSVSTHPSLGSAELASNLLSPLNMETTMLLWNQMMGTTMPNCQQLSSAGQPTIPQLSSSASSSPVVLPCVAAGLTQGSHLGGKTIMTAPSLGHQRQSLAPGTKPPLIPSIEQVAVKTEVEIPVKKLPTCKKLTTSVATLSISEEQATSQQSSESVTGIPHPRHESTPSQMNDRNYLPETCHQYKPASTSSVHDKFTVIEPKPQREVKVRHTRKHQESDSDSPARLMELTCMGDWKPNVDQSEFVRQESVRGSTGDLSFSNVDCRKSEKQLVPRELSRQSCDLQTTNSRNRQSNTKTACATKMPAKSRKPIQLYQIPQRARKPQSASQGVTDGKKENEVKMLPLESAASEHPNIQRDEQSRPRYRSEGIFRDDEDSYWSRGTEQSSQGSEWQPDESEKRTINISSMPFRVPAASEHPNIQRDEQSRPRYRSEGIFREDGDSYSSKGTEQSSEDSNWEPDEGEKRTIHISSMPFRVPSVDLRADEQIMKQCRKLGNVKPRVSNFHGTKVIISSNIRDQSRGRGAWKKTMETKHVSQVGATSVKKLRNLPDESDCKRAGKSSSLPANKEGVVHVFPRPGLPAFHSLKK